MCLILESLAWDLMHTWEHIRQYVVKLPSANVTSEEALLALERINSATQRLYRNILLLCSEKNMMQLYQMVS
jgi:hypothetical protein